MVILLLLLPIIVREDRIILYTYRFAWSKFSGTSWFNVHRVYYYNYVYLYIFKPARVRHIMFYLIGLWNNYKLQVFTTVIIEEAS